MTRQRQLWALIFLSALTAAAQYVIQGSISTGADPREFPPLFWYADYFFWAFRGLVEAWVVIYLFTTNVEGLGRNIVLTALEVLLLALITFTVGPALQAVGRNLNFDSIFSPAQVDFVVAHSGFALHHEPDHNGARELLLDRLRNRRREVLDLPVFSCHSFAGEHKYHEGDTQTGISDSSICFYLWAS